VHGPKKKEKNDVEVQLKDYFGQALALARLNIITGVGSDIFEQQRLIPNLRPYIQTSI
jgi:hypothetical protein